MFFWKLYFGWNSHQKQKLITWHDMSVMHFVPTSKPFRCKSDYSLLESLRSRANPYSWYKFSMFVFCCVLLLEWRNQWLRLRKMRNKGLVKNIYQKQLTDTEYMYDISWELSTLDQVKFLEITELLVAAGYFRARIKGLAPFDKVVWQKYIWLPICIIQSWFSK